MKQYKNTGHSSGTVAPLNMRPAGCPETSVTLKRRQVTSQKS